MSFETTMICDGCGSVLDGGDKDSLAAELWRNKGRAFRRNGRGWSELRTPRGFLSASRHLGPCCANRTKFGDASPVPVPAHTEEKGEG